jgi:hypothetical protein
VTIENARALAIAAGNVPNASMAPFATFIIDFEKVPIF